METEGECFDDNFSFRIFEQFERLLIGCLVTNTMCYYSIKERTNNPVLMELRTKKKRCTLKGVIHQKIM